MSSYRLILENLIISKAASLRDSLQAVFLLERLRHNSSRQSRQNVAGRDFSGRHAVRLDHTEDDLGQIRILEAVDGVNVDPDVGSVSKCCHLIRKESIQQPGLDTRGR